MILKLSSAQCDALGRDSHLRRLIALIRDRFAGHAAGCEDATLGPALWEQTLLARRYGLDDERSAATFALTAWLLGQGFERNIAALAQILDSAALSPTRKARALEDFMLLLFHTLEGAGMADAWRNGQQGTSRKAP